jgi:hypothetical protein
MIAIVLTASFIEILDSGAQSVSYSTAASYSHTTEWYPTTVTASQIAFTGEPLKISGRILATDISDLVYELSIKNVSNQGLMRVEVAARVKHENGTWTESYVVRFGDVVVGESQFMVRRFQVDINLRDQNIEGGHPYCVRASTLREVTTTKKIS